MVSRVDRGNLVRGFWPAALVVAAIALVWWIRMPGEERPPTPAGGGPRAADAAARNPERHTAATERSAGADSDREPIDVAPPPKPDGVHVTVLAPDDTPVPGVPVELTARLPGSGYSASRFARADTDAHGVAILAAEPEKLQKMDQLGVDLVFEVRADVPLPDPPSAELGDDPRTAEPVVLRTAAFGSADVRVTGPDGAPVDDGGPVYLFWRAPGSDGQWEREGIPSAPSAGGGRAHFGIVPLGRELLFRATGAGRFAYGETSLPGPTRAGESVDVTIRLGPALPFVVGRLVDETGAPLADVKVSVGVANVPRDAPPDTLPERSRMQYRWRTTDAEGVLRTVVYPRRDPEHRRVLAIAQDDSRRAGGGEVVRHAIVPLDFELRGGADNDVGTIALVPDGEERVLVQGIVVDENGEPLQGADVSAGYWDRDAGKHRSLHRNRVRSGPDGRFEIRSAREAPATFGVSASASRRVPASVEATPGARDVELRLVRGGTLSAWVRVPDGVPSYQIVGRIGDGQPNQFAGRFGYDNLAAGRYDVTVWIQNTSWEIGRVAGVEVPAGGVADDPRLKGIEVACRTLRLAVQRADGTPLSDSWIQVQDEHGRGGSFRTDGDGCALVVVPSASATFRIHDGGDTRAEVTWREDEQTVRLAPR